MVNFIKLTYAHADSSGDVAYVNPQHIGHIHTYTENGILNSREVSGRVVTSVGVTTHNGGLMVMETPEQIIRLIKDAELSMRQIRAPGGPTC